MGARKGPRDPNFANEEFRGYGKLKCQACGKPLRDHEGLGPCPALDIRAGERLAIQSRQAQHNRKSYADLVKERKRNGRQKQQAKT